ncbi:hypothetical protein LSG25_13945 [Paralcaligenes sp. KSB-10]|uniref:hypothetical protein n=1 Tax=Paralcaligenes sp. KSB-10 TaxID=2901142 RepID=UPI001E4029E4|nr:hypothetical protein [Paralcaligenes sp. KSB-10]UHL63158.1 hypothetical protein LSG25_13945 [Paralcaligenes sp. KSB-10]
MDFLTGKTTTRVDYERNDPKGKAFLRPAHWRRHLNQTSEAFPFLLITERELDGTVNHEPSGIG